MNVNDVSIGWALRQSNPAEALDRCFENVRRWGARKSETFSSLCGEEFTNKEVVLTHVACVLLVLACGVAEWLEGGALWK